MKRPALHARRYARLALPAAGAAMVLLVVLSLFAGEADTAELAGLLERYRAAAQPAAETKPAETSPGEPPQDAGGARPPSAQEQQAQRVGQRKPFHRPVPPEPIKLVGVLGDRAYFEGNPEGLAVGAEFKGATIREIGPDYVVLERGGQAETQHVWDASGGGPPGGGGPGPGMVPPGPSMPPPSAGEPAPGPRPGGPIEIPPEALEQFRAMPPAQREEILRNAPPEVREQILRSL